MPSPITVVIDQKILKFNTGYYVDGFAVYYYSNRRAYELSSFWLPSLSSVVVKNYYYYYYYYCIDFDCRFQRSTCGTGFGGCLCFPLHCFLLRNRCGCSCCLPSPPPWLPSIIFVPAQSTLIICSCLAFKPVLKPEAVLSLFPLHSYSYSEASSSLSLLSSHC